MIEDRGQKIEDRRQKIENRGLKIQKIAERRLDRNIELLNVEEGREKYFFSRTGAGNKVVYPKNQDGI